MKENISFSKTILRFNKGGFYIEFKDFSKYFLFFIIKKTLSFLVDIGLFLIIYFILIFSFKINIWNASIITFLVSFIVNFVQLLIFKDCTIGMKLSSIKIVEYDGKKLSKAIYKKITRSIVFAMFLVPFVNILFFILIFIGVFFNRGISIFDYLTKTQILTYETSGKISKLYKEIDKYHNN